MADEASEVRAQIAEDLQAIANTVQELAAKADITGRLKSKAAERGEELHRKAQELGGQIREINPESAKETVTAVAGRARKRPLPVLVVAALLAGLIIRKRILARRS